MNTYLWLLRRELWEYRSIWTLPAWVGFGLLLGTMLGTLDAGTGANHLTISFGFGALGREPRNVFLFSAIAATFYLLMTLYVGWYLLDCLYADRKDRSVLFWKSMPVSDRDTVLVKLVTAMVVIPMVFYGFAQLTTAAHAIFFSLRSGGRAALDPWNAGLWTGMQLLWLYAIFTGALWFLPVAGWMMLVSAWGRRAVFGWTLAVPVIAVVAERLVLGTQRVSDAIGERLWAGYKHAAFDHVDLDGAVAGSGMWRNFDLPGFLTNGRTWLGVVLGAALVYAAIQMRQRRGEL